MQSAKPYTDQHNVKFKMLYVISVNGNVCVLRYVSIGQSFRSFGFPFRTDHYTVGKIVDQFSDVLWTRLSSKHVTVPDHDRFLDTATKFKEIWNFPNVIGCINGKHISIKCPPKAGSLLYNYKQFFSVVLQGVADSECRFIFIDVGAYGKQSDGGTFSASTLYSITSWKTLNLPYRGKWN
jgi:hypothetical protein